MRKFFFLICVLFFIGCNKYCPPFPDEQLVWLPTLEVGDVVVYSNGEKSIEFVVKNRNKTDGHKDYCTCGCEIRADMFLESEDLILLYRNNIMDEVNLNKVWMSVEIKFNNLFLNEKWPLLSPEEQEPFLWLLGGVGNFNFRYDSKTQQYENRYWEIECVENIKIAGVIYNDVLRLTAKSDDYLNPIFYYVKSYGIIRFELVDGQMWDLVKFGNNTVMFQIRG